MLDLFLATMTYIVYHVVTICLTVSYLSALVLVYLVITGPVPVLMTDYVNCFLQQNNRCVIKSA